ncbi:hypothetical protein [Chitinophaga sancti]|uniref:hypothetical protein n=1 Tax=Chitinophaga sancti TaxID=1004 RepID=UPI003F79D879
MRKPLLILALLYCSHSLVAQQFTANYNKDSTLTGFDNASTKTRIAPQFVTVGGSKFQDVVAVMKEDKQGKWYGYYLFSSMKTAGTDSLYMFDNAFDCENEGFIRFTDHKTEQTGIFNRNGKIVVPAAYNYVSMVTNGMVIALQGAKKVQDGEHFYYSGGKTLLIDTTNKVLVSDFGKAEDLNMYSVKIADTPSADTTRMSFAGVNGKYYTFQVYGKEFSQWLHQELLPGLTKEKLAANTFAEVTYWDEENWIHEDKKKFIDKHWDFLLAKFRDGAAFNLVSGNFNPFIMEGPLYDKYMNNCFQSKDWQYPSWSIFFGGSNEKGQLDFLRTEEGYKLIGVGFAK